VARGMVAPARWTWPVALGPFPPSIASTGCVCWRGKLAEVVWGCKPQYPQDRAWGEPPGVAQPTRQRRVELGADRRVLQGGAHILRDQVESWLLPCSWHLASFLLQQLARAMFLGEESSPG
jgi:hypothetical protein